MARRSTVFPSHSPGNSTTRLRPGGTCTIWLRVSPAVVCAKNSSSSLMPLAELLMRNDGAAPAVAHGIREATCSIPALPWSSSPICSSVTLMPVGHS